MKKTILILTTFFAINSQALNLNNFASDAGGVMSNILLLSLFGAFLTGIVFVFLSKKKWSEKNSTMAVFYLLFGFALSSAGLLSPISQKYMKEMTGYEIISYKQEVKISDFEKEMEKY